MKRELFLLFVISLILLTGCEQEELAEELELEQPQDQGIIQEQSVEETEEQVEEPSCLDECISESCSGYKFFDCVLQDDGCKDKVEKGVVKGKCGVECLFNSDCSQDQDCLSYKCKIKETSLNLDNLPEPFLENALIVLGADGASLDVFSAVEIATMLQHETGKEVPKQLDNEVAGQESNYNLILIGGPCNNLAVERVFGITCGGLELDEGKAIIKLITNDDNVAMLIAGKTPSDTLRASKMVANYESYSLEGTERIV